MPSSASATPEVNSDAKASALNIRLFIIIRFPFDFIFLCNLQQAFLCCRFFVRIILQEVLHKYLTKSELGYAT